MPATTALSAGLKALIASKHFWPILIGGGLLGQTALSELGRAGERGLTREELRLQKILAESQISTTKKAVEESRTRAKEYTEALLKSKREERQATREQDLMEMFMAGQDRQVALLMQAIQGISQQRPQYRAGASYGGGGLLGLMGSNF